MRPGGQLEKGHAFERRVANDLKKFFPEAKRGFQTRGGGKEQADVINTPFHIECKHHADLNMQAAFEQACRDSAFGVPVAIGMENRKRPRVMMWWRDLGQLLGWPEVFGLKCDPQTRDRDCAVEIPYAKFLELIESRYGRQQ